jgi:hypothetical protein
VEGVGEREANLVLRQRREQQKKQQKQKEKIVAERTSSKQPTE